MAQQIDQTTAHPTPSNNPEMRNTAVKLNPRGGFCSLPTAVSERTAAALIAISLGISFSLHFKFKFKFKTLLSIYSGTGTKGTGILSQVIKIQ